MDINKLKAELLDKAISYIADSKKDFSRRDDLRLLSDEEVRTIANGIEINECVRSFVEDSSGETFPADAISVNKDLEVVHFNLILDSGHQKKRKDFLKEFHRKQGLCCGDFAWNWTRMLEDQGPIVHEGKVVQDVEKVHLEKKEMDLARRSVTAAINAILIRLYERLITLYPDNYDLYNALTNVLEFNCKFLDRIKILEIMFEKFGGGANAIELCWAYGDSKIYDKAHALHLRIKSGEFNSPAK